MQVQEHSDLIATIGTNLGWLLAAGLSGLVMYWKTKPPKAPDPIVTGVGVELGNRMQMDALIAEQKRCADYLSVISSHLAVLADRKQEAIEDKLDVMLQRLEERERRG